MIIGLMFFYEIHVKQFKKQMKIRSALLIIIGGVVGSYLYTILSEDESFRSKVYIFDIFVDGIQIKDTFWFGMGIGNSKEFLGIYAHNIFLLYFLEIGFIGLLLWLIMIITILVKTNWVGLIILFPFLIAAQSAVGYGAHYLYTALAMVYLLNKKIKNEKNTTICNKWDDRFRWK
jgi:hypothetical protein